MPGYQEIGPASTPLLYLENQNQLMLQRAADWEDNLKRQGLDYETYVGEIQKKQAEVDDFRAEFDSEKRTLQQSQRFVDLKIITPKEHIEAAWERMLPRELFEKMYPRLVADTQRVPFSPSQMEGHQEYIETFMKLGKKPTKKKFGIDWLAKDVHTQKSLLRLYDTWKVNIGYDGYGAVRQGQLDNEWDAWIMDEYNTKEKKIWNPEDKEVKAARGKGPLTKDYGAPARKTPTRPGEGGDPMADSIAADLSKRRKPEPKPKPEPQPRIWIWNSETKERRFSDDGGRTWQTE